MNHGHFGVSHKYTTLVLSHWKFTIDNPLGIRPPGLSTVSFL